MFQVDSAHSVLHCIRQHQRFRNRTPLLSRTNDAAGGDWCISQLLSRIKRNYLSRYCSTRYIPPYLLTHPSNTLSYLGKHSLLRKDLSYQSHLRIHQNHPITIDYMGVTAHHRDYIQPELSSHIVLVYPFVMTTQMPTLQNLTK